jgi:methylenetetrahydrofolate reductase (NADPH)
MIPLSEKFEQAQDFLIGVELVSTRGTMAETRAAKTVAYSRELAANPRIDWVSITDNAGGNPMLAAPALGGPLRDAGREVVIHLSCKDFNRNGLESEAWHLASEGFRNLLVLTGDYAGTGIAGGAKPVFDIDSVGLLTLLGQMNAGLDVTRDPAKKPVRLEPTKFFPGAVVTNFKLHENEIIPQLLKMERKIASGARFLINQIGYDSRKIHELIAWLRQRGHGQVPLIGNVYVLNPTVARIFRAKRIPGVVIADELAELCERHAASPDKGRAFFLELAAKQVAVYRGLGYRGAYLGGVHSGAEIDRVLEIERGFGADDWRQFAREIRYSRPGEWFAYGEDASSGLADVSRPAAPGQPRARNITYTYRFSKFAHDLMFTPGKGIAKLGARLCASAKDPLQGPGWMRVIEHASKSALFGCKDCGDCSLPEIAFLCPESACAKNQRNGPCGGTRDGLCEVADFECIWSRAYDRLKYEGRAGELLAHAPVLQDQNLRGTSSWANTWLGRDHLAKRAAAPAANQVSPSHHSKP